MADSFEWTEYLDQLKKILSFDLNDDHIFFLNQYARFISNNTDVIFYKRGLHWDQKKDVSKRGFLIHYVVRVDPDTKLVSLQSSENVLELRHRFGDNLYIPIEISSSVSIYHGHTPIPLAGSGTKDPWEKSNGVWIKIDSIQTWIS
jgi:hypothetical protein